MLSALRPEDPFAEEPVDGVTGSANLLVRYLNQGRAEGNRPVTTPRRLTRLLLTHPEHLWTKDTDLLGILTAACPEMTALTRLTRLTGEFAALLTPAQANDNKLTQWITDVRAINLPHLHSFCNGLELDRAAVNAGLTLPHHNGRTEGVNTRTKKSCGRCTAEPDSTSSATASSSNVENAPSPPTTEQSRTFDTPRHGRVASSRQPGWRVAEQFGTVSAVSLSSTSSDRGPPVSEELELITGVRFSG